MLFPVMRKRVATIMLVRNLKRMLTDAVRSIVRNGFMSVASILVSVACLFVFGVFMLLTIFLYAAEVILPIGIPSMLH